MLQAPVSPIHRRFLRDEVVALLRERLAEGDPAPGERINESRLSAALGVSRTPLREALLHMEKEGLVVSEPARGFLAAPLTVREARDVMPVLAALEALALRASGGLVLRALPELLDLHVAYEGAPEARAAAAIDERWHDALVAGCSNERLLTLIGQYRRVVRRYYLALPARKWPHAGSLFQHRTILDELEKADLIAAGEALERHWAAATRELLSALDRNGH